MPDDGAGVTLKVQRKLRQQSAEIARLQNIHMYLGAQLEPFEKSSQIVTKIPAERFDLERRRFRRREVEDEPRSGAINIGSDERLVDLKLHRHKSPSILGPNSSQSYELAFTGTTPGSGDYSAASACSASSSSFSTLGGDMG